MKTFLLCICSCLIFANANAQLFFPQEKISLRDATSIIRYLKEHYQELQHEDISLNIIFYKKSLASHHYTFEVLYKQLRLLYANIKVNTALNGQLLTIKKENIETDKLAMIDIDFERNQWNQIAFASLFDKSVPINQYDYQIDTRSINPSVVAVVHSYGKTFDNTYIMNRQGELIEEWNNSRFLQYDTLVQTQVFNPDPLTQLGVTYGAPYIDDNDNNLAWFGPAYMPKNIVAHYDTGSNTFYLENNWVVIDDFDAPTVLPATSPTPNFMFNRSESGFEDANALYHITTFHHYISSIGYDTLMNDIITVDTHGMLGADNSMFNRNGGFPTLDFGTGGVDDAEDADVIIHEYSHALSWSANNNSNFSTQRSGLDEGLSDYFATSYSRNINPMGWENMFSWDGHNQYWGGRTATTPNNYPNGANIYAIGEIWNAAMSAIWTDLGQIVTDKLMLESMHFFTDNTTLPEAALYVLQSDTLLFNGIHTNTICTHFKNKNIFDANCKPTSLNHVAESLNGIQVKNTYGFAHLNESIEIDFPQISSGEMILFDLKGKKLMIEKFEGKTSVLFKQLNIPSGIYFLQIKTNKELKVVKINK
ncbi:MAG: T9SS type A sorting domain-containing protein [Bacteroidetes bacterium]|nr:T9SS type A sorting domain-containing protein [Bacteroidota bacterium]